jgi:hypothetical protein
MINNTWLIQGEWLGNITINNIMGKLLGERDVLGC